MMEKISFLNEDGTFVIFSGCRGEWTQKLPLAKSGRGQQIKPECIPFRAGKYREPAQ